MQSRTLASRRKLESVAAEGTLLMPPVCHGVEHTLGRVDSFGPKEVSFRKAQAVANVKVSQ